MSIGESVFGPGMVILARMPKNMLTQAEEVMKPGEADFLGLGAGLKVAYYCFHLIL